jgi:pyridoxal 5'-phosphate synthase pdxS subunit
MINNKGDLLTQKFDLSAMHHGKELLKRGFARMQQGGVVMDVVNAEQAHIAEDAGACSVMALERVPADIRKDGGVARMSHPDLIREIIETTSIPVMAKSRIGHFQEARILEELGVDMVDESEVLTPADLFFHIPKNDFEIPFVCGATSLGEAVRRISEGAAMIRTKGEAGTGNIVSAVKHARIIQEEISYIQRANENEIERVEKKILEAFKRIDNISELGIQIEKTPFGTLDDCRNQISSVVKDIQKLGRLPVITFSAGGIATPADAALMMNMGMDGIFVGSGIFKSENPTQTAEAIVYATHHFDDAAKVTEASSMVGEAMKGLEIETLDVKMEKRGL